MDRRTLLTISTSACLCGTYGLYRMLVSPLISPGPDLLNERSLSGAEFNSKPSEKHEQAEKYLPDQPWAADATYEIRNDPTYVYFGEYKPIEQSGRVRFKPFAMIWRPKGHDPNEVPITIVCDSAVVEFAEKFEIASIRNPGRIVGGNLEGAVRIRGPNGMAIDGNDFNFAERSLRAWSDSPVKFAYGPHSGSGNGIEVELIKEPGSPKEDKPAIAGVRTLRLIKEVVMDLVAESKGANSKDTQSKVGAPKVNGQPRETVQVTSAGAFEFDVESHVATFQKSVRVIRPTGSEQFDKLSCEQLTLVFEPEPPAEIAAGAAAATPDVPKPSNATSPFGGDVKLQFRRLRAEGEKTTVVSQRSEMRAVMQELTYDEQARVVALRDAKQVRMLQRNNELRCPEVTAVLDEAGQIEQATCRGAGKLFSYAQDPENLRQPQARKQIEFAAEWLRQLRMESDPATKLDLIEFSGQAVLSQPGKMALRAEVVRLWVTPDKEGQGMADRPIAAEGSGPKPQKMLALGNAEFASPQITGATERLLVWFKEGPLPPPPTVGPVDRSRKHGVLRPARTSGRQTATVVPAIRPGAERPGNVTRGQPRGDAAVRYAAQADVGNAKAPARPQRRKNGEKPAPNRSEAAPPENPLHVVADVISVQTIMVEGGDPSLSEVVTEGRVHITQSHGNDEAPFDLRGDRLHLQNFSDTHQVIDVTGKGAPAHIHDRGMQLEGGDIHFDRGRNLARVEGPGVLRLPVKTGLDGKRLESPQLLDVFWKEKMEFDGETADFFAEVRTQLNGSEMQCEEMHVTLAQRISFAEEADRSQQTDVRLVVCRDGVRLKSHQYDSENRTIEIREARGFEFTLDQTTGNVSAQGPGTLILKRRGTGNRAGLANSNGVKANRPLKTETAEWEYARVDFSGRMNGSTKEQTTKFKDRVRIVYGPVSGVTDTIDADELPLSGGWMRCEELDLTQLVGTGPSPETSMAVVGRGNAELEGRSDHGLFHARAGKVSFDGSKGLYSLFGEGGHDATLWREQHVGSSRGSIDARRMEFIPSRDFVNIQDASGAQGGR